MKRSLHLLSAVLLAFLLIPAHASKLDSKSGQQPTPFSALIKAVDKVIDGSITDGQIHGAVVLVSYDGELIYQRAAGYADPLKKIPMREDTIFRLSSVSKVYTSMAAAALVKNGKLGFDDPVTKWLPDFKPKLPNGETPVITIRHLLSHTAGLDYGFAQAKNGPYLKEGISDGMDESGITLDENIRRIGKVPLLFPPGSSWHYSLSPDVLGAVIAKAHGTTFQQAMADLVSKPLGIKDTGFYIKAADKNRTAVPYYLSDGKLVRMKAEQVIPAATGEIRFSLNRAFDPNAFPSGGAGMVGTAPDLMLLLESMRKGGAPLTDKQTMKEMSAKQTGKMTPDPNFALGWAVMTLPSTIHDEQPASTMAWGGVYGHSWLIDTRTKLSVITMTTTAWDSAIYLGVRKAVYTNLPSRQFINKNRKN